MTSTKLFWLLIILAAACAVSLILGPAGLSIPSIILDIRLPRTAAAVIVGAGLGLSGAIFQSLLKNPLSDPYILGTSSGATAAAVLCLSLGVERSTLIFYAMVFAGAFSATFISYGVARSARNLSEAGLVLSGIVVGSFITALVMLFLSLSKERSFSMLYFVMGGIYSAEPGLLAISALIVLGVFLVSFFSWRRLDLFSLGEEKAYHLGASPAQARLFFFALASAATAGAVAIGGTIGFVGLMAPHIVRLAFGASNRTLLPASALGGAVFLSIADTIGRTVAAPSEIPSGVITALIGAPFFLWLLCKNSRGRA
ncbi:MAG: iron ABC transporter permease [Elusimicrobia bacterium]|nr:iron ABC transporter permease [Elusimicrobiota bacterium]